MAKWYMNNPKAHKRSYGRKVGKNTFRQFKIQSGKRRNWLDKSNIFYLYAHRRRDVLCDHPWRTVSPILCPEHISKTASYGYEISWVDRSHQGRVQCTGTITLAC